jgi:hypothetical protein
MAGAFNEFIDLSETLNADTKTGKNVGPVEQEINTRFG